MEGTVLDRRFTIAVEDRRGETALRCIGHVASRVVYRPRSSIGQQKPRPGRRRTGFVCPARYLQAEANLALAAFIVRPQAEAQIGATEFYQSTIPSINGGAAARGATQPRDRRSEHRAATARARESIC